jgi:fibronectin-binding autotransporter adhesin
MLFLSDAMHFKQHNPIPAKIESPLLPCRILLLLTLFIAVWSPCLTLGQTWNGGGGNDNWTTGANWSVTPVAGNALTFGGTTRLGPVNDFAADTAFAGITFNNTAGAFVLTGNRITLTNNITNSDADLQTLNLDMILGATRTFNVNAGSIAVGGILSGVGGLTLATDTSAARTLTLTGNNSYSGTTTVNGGILQISGLLGDIAESTSIIVGNNSSAVTRLFLDNTLGALNRIGDTTNVTLGGMGELSLAGNGATASVVETIGGLTIGTGTVSTPQTISLSGTGAGQLVTLAGSGFTRVNNSTALIRGTNLGLQATNATRLTLVSIAGLTFVGTTTANGTSPGTATDVRIVPYLIGDTSATGTGSSFVTYDTTGGLRPLAAGEYTTLTAGYAAPANRENVNAFNGSITAASPTVNSLRFNTASQTLSGSGTLTVSSGAVAVVASNVVIGGGFSGLTLGDGIWNEGVLTSTGTNTLRISTPLTITNNGALTKTGAGTVLLTASSTYTGVTRINHGILVLNHSNALGTTAGNTIINYTGDGNGGRLQLQGSITLAEPITIQGPGSGSARGFSNALEIVSGVNTITGPITASSSMDFRFGSSSGVFGTQLNINGGISGTAVGTQAGAGVININSTLPSGFSAIGGAPEGGYTLVSVAGVSHGNVWFNGSVRLGVNNGLLTTTALNIGQTSGTGGTGIVDLGGFQQTVAGLLGGATGGVLPALARRVTNLATGTTSTLTIHNGGQIFDGLIYDGAGTIAVVKSGTGTQTFSQLNTYSGDTTVSGGILALGHVNAILNSTLDTGTSGTQSVTFTAAGTNTYNLGGLKGGDQLDLALNSISVGANNQSTSFTGVLHSTGGGLVKVGTGSLTLAGANTYTGSTTLSGGFLLLDYTASNTSKLANAGTLILTGGTLQLDRSSSPVGSHTEVVASTTVNGPVSIVRSGGTSTLTLNAITRNTGGLLNFGVASLATTDTNNVNGILGPWATIAGTDFATSVDSGAADTAITAYTGYTNFAATGSTLADGATTNVRLNAAGSGGNIALGAAITTVNTLLQGTGTAATVDTAAQTLRVGGILVASGQHALTIGVAAGDGSLTAASAGGELILQNFAGNPLTINAVIANHTSASSLTTGGTGNIVLAGANTFTGATNIGGGTLTLTGAGTLPTAANVNLASNTAILDLSAISAASQTIGSLTGLAGSSVVLGTKNLLTGADNSSTTFAGGFSGTGGVTKQGSGTFTLAGASTHSGDTVVSAGTLAIAHVNALQNSTLDTGASGSQAATFDLTRIATYHLGGLKGGDALDIGANTLVIGSNNQDTTYSGTLSGTASPIGGSVVKTGSGHLTLSGAQAYTGMFTMNSGTVTLSNSNSFRHFFLNGGTANINNAGALGNTGGSLVIAGGTLDNTTVAAITASAKQLVLNGDFAFTGTRDLALGNTIIALGGSGTARSITANANTLTLGGTMTDGLTATGLTKLGAGTLALTGNSTNTGTMTVNAGTLTLSGSNNFGDLILNAGTLNLNNVGAVGNSSSGSLIINGGTLNNTSAGSLISVNKAVALNADFTFTGTQSLNLGTAAVALGGSGTTRSVTVTANTLTLGGAIGNGVTATGLTKLGTGVLSLGGISAYTGLTTVSAGVLAITSNGALGTTGSGTIVSNGAQLRLDVGGLNVAEPLTIRGDGLGSTGALYNLSGTNTYSGPITVDLAAGARIQAANGTTLNLTGGVTNSGTGSLRLSAQGASAAINVNTTPLALGSANTLLISDPGVVTLGVAGNTFGIANIGYSGTLRTGAANVLPLGTIVSLGEVLDANAGTGTLDLNGFDQTVSGLRTTASVTLGTRTVTSGTAATLTVSQSTNTTYDGRFTGALALAKQGAGTLTLSGSGSTNTGATTVSEGILRVTGSTSASSAMGVSGGVLTGTGTVGGAVTLSGTGSIDLRDGAVGNLTFSGTLDITGAAGANNLHFDLGNTTNTTDKIIVGSVTSVTTAGAAVIQLNQLGGTAGRNAAGTYTLIQGTTSMAALGQFALPTSNAFGQTFALTVSGNNLNLITTHVTAATPAAFWAGTTDVNWSNAANWRDTVAGNGAVAGAPDFQTNVTFATTTPTPANLTTNVLDTDFDINSLNFNALTGGVTIGGTRMLTLEATAANGNTAGNGINSANTSGTNTISANVGLAASQTWTVDTGGTLAVTGVVGDFGGGRTLTKAGGGTLILGGAAPNTYTGLTTVNGGTLELNKTAGVNAITGDGVAGTNDIQVNTGATLRLAAANQIADNATVFLNGGTWNLNGHNETIRNLNAVVATTVPTLTLGTGSTLTLNRIDWDNNPGSIVTSNIGGATAGASAGTLRFVADGATQPIFDTNYNGTVNVNSAVQIDATSLTFNASTYGTTVNGKISGTGKVIHGPSGQAGGLTLTNGSNDYSGGTQWNGSSNPSGAWILFTVSASGALGTGDVTIQGGNLNTWVSGFSGVPSAFIFTGGTTSHANNFILSGNANLSVSSPDAATTTADRVTLSGTVNLGANTLYVRGRGTGTISGQISGTGGITKIDTPGTWVLSGANTYSGATTVSAGALQVGSSGAGQTGTGAVTVQTGSTLLGTGTVRGTSFTADNGSTLHAGDSTVPGSFGTLNFTPASSGGTLSLQGSLVLGIGTANNHGSIDPLFGGNDVGTSGYFSYVNDVSRSQGLGAGGHDLLSFNNPSGGGSTSLNFLTTTGSLQVLGSGFTAAKGQIFNLLDWGTLVTANFTGFNLGSNYRDGSGDTGSPFDLPDISSSGLVWDVSQFTTSGVIVVVPEPSRVLLMLGGFAALLLRRRRAKV